jgi:hypothetical protein
MCIYSLSVCTNSLRLAYPIFAFTNIYGICVSPTTNRKELAQFSRKSILCECISGLNARAARVCNLMSLRSSGNYSSPWEMCPKIYSFEFCSVLICMFCLIVRLFAAVGCNLVS